MGDLGPVPGGTEGSESHIAPPTASRWHSTRHAEMLRRAPVAEPEELCCSGSVVHAADASPVDRGQRMCVGRRCSACRVARLTVELAQAYRQNGSICVECCSKVRYTAITVDTAIHGDTVYRMYHAPSGGVPRRATGAGASAVQREGRTEPTPRLLRASSLPIRDRSLCRNTCGRVPASQKRKEGLTL
jgi:hypothetical protein